LGTKIPAHPVSGNIRALRVAMQQSPSKTRAARQVGISCRSLQRIVRSDVPLFPPHKLAPGNKGQMLHFTTWTEHKESVLHKIWFSD